jgi:GTP-binding protein Era
MDHRSGFAALVGRPNAGKSTLTNALVKAKVAIASDKPQTTRHLIRGIVTQPGAQLVIVDTPGLHRPRTLLGERLNQLVYDTWSEVDVLGVCLPCPQPIGPGDRYLVSQIAGLARHGALFALATQSDLASPARVRRHLLDIDQLQAQYGLTWADIVPVSGLTGDNVDLLRDLLLAQLPPGPAYYPADAVSDEPTEQVVAELIREAALDLVRQELPHSIAVTIDEMGLRPGRADDRPLLDIYANLIVERDSQKPIMVGHQGARLKQIGSTARQRISRLLAIPVYLDLRVKIVKEWQRDPKALNRLGF